MKQLRNVLDTILVYVCSGMMGLMSILVVYQVVARYFFNAPSTFSEELMIYLFIWMSLLGGTYIFGRKEHMAMTFLYNSFSPAVKKAADYLIQIVGLIFGAALLYGGSSIVKLILNQKTPALGIPMGYLYMILPVCGVGILIYTIMNLADLANENRR